MCMYRVVCDFWPYVGWLFTVQKSKQGLDLGAMHRKGL